MIGSHIAQSAAGTPLASRVAVNERRRRVEGKEDSRGRDEDVVDVPVSEVEQTDAVRRAKGNGDEDAREDRQESGYYAALGAPHEKRTGENVDLSA